MRIKNPLIILYQNRMSLYDLLPDKYLFDQTPEEVAIQLIAKVPIQPGDVLYEPFKGEGAFYRNFPTECTNHWAEIREGVDYKVFQEPVDWIITNPPYRMESGKNCIIPLIFEFMPRVRKGIAFLCNDQIISSLTPLRRAKMAEQGFHLSKITILNVKKWRGRYYFLQITKQPSPDIDYLVGNF